MGKLIDLNSQETKDKIADKCFYAISKALYNLTDEKSITKNMTFEEVMNMFCNKYRLTKEEFIQSCDSTGKGTYLRELMNG